MSALFTNQGSDATGTDYVDWPGGRGAIYLTGDLGGGTFTLEARPPNSNSLTDFQLVRQSSINALGWDKLELPACQLRGKLTGSTSPGLYASAFPNPRGA